MRILENDETTGQPFWLPVGGRAILVNSGVAYVASADWFFEACPRDLNTRTNGNWTNSAGELAASPATPWAPGGMWLRVRARTANAVVGPRIDFSIVLAGNGMFEPMPEQPSQPDNVRAEAVAGTTATVRWDEGPAVVNGDALIGFQYRVKVGAAAFGAWTNVTGDATAREQDVTGLTASSAIAVQVRAVTNRYDTDAGEVLFDTTA